MIIYLYRWRLRPNKIEQFKDNWCLVTAYLYAHAKSLGSRLHLGSDGIYYAYAQWPNIEGRAKANFDCEQIEDALTKMRDAVEESFPEVMLNPLSDYLAEFTGDMLIDGHPSLNQITIGSNNLDASISFYKKLGLQLIVLSHDYARFECPSGTTLSLELLLRDGYAGTTAIYFEHPQLDLWVAALKDQGLVFEKDPENMRWLWKEAWLKDPFGNRVCLFHAGKNRRFPPWRLT